MATFSEDFLKVLAFPPFSTIRVIEIADVIERLDSIFIAIFYATTFLKFLITYYVICQITKEFFGIGELKAVSLPIGILLGISMPFLFPRFDIIGNNIVPYFYASIPLLFIMPVVLYITIMVKDKGQKKLQKTKRVKH